MKKLATICFAFAIVMTSTVGLARAETATETTVKKTPAQILAEKEVLIKERIAEKKLALEEKITAAQTARIQKRCQAAQTILKKVETRVTERSEKHQTRYDALVSKLTGISERLQAQQVDTTKLDIQIVVVKEKIATYDAASSAYLSAIATTRDMDCQSDPSEFKASLETLREQRAEVVTSIKDIRTYVIETVKPTLQGIVTTLKQQANKTEGSN